MPWKKVIKFAKNHLNSFFPVKNFPYEEITKIQIINAQLIFYDKNSNTSKLLNPNQFKGYIGSKIYPKEIILSHNNLCIRLKLDKTHPVGKSDSFHLCDVIVESAPSVIMDCEDSVVSVDTNDKISTFRNWLGLLDGSIKVEIYKDKVSSIRKLSKNISYKKARRQNSFHEGIITPFNKKCWAPYEFIFNYR